MSNFINSANQTPRVKTAHTLGFNIATCIMEKKSYETRYI